MRALWILSGLMFAVAYCQTESQSASVHSIISAMVIATPQDQEDIRQLEVIVQNKGDLANTLTQWCKRKGFMIQPASSREGTIYIFSNRVLRSSAMALQQIIQFLESGNPLPVIPNTPIYENLKILLRTNEFVRFRNLDSFLSKYDHALIMLSGEIVANIEIDRSNYSIDIGQIYKYDKESLSSNKSEILNIYKKQDKQIDAQKDIWEIHFLGLLPLTDRERNEMVTEALMLQREYIEKEEQMRKQVIQSLIHQMERKLHEDESIEIGRRYSVDEIPQRWQDIIRRVLAEKRLLRGNMANVRIQFSVAPGLQFLLGKGDRWQVLGFRLAETRVFSYALDESNF